MLQVAILEVLVRLEEVTVESVNFNLDMEGAGTSLLYFEKTATVSAMSRGYLPEPLVFGSKLPT